ncbi:hypothetical protein AWC11_17275 [Mycobacterium interjectum]|nr:hypothetical protein AWC11_17275 [Mycobacterium interjectum]
MPDAESDNTSSDSEPHEASGHTDSDSLELSGDSDSEAPDVSEDADGESNAGDREPLELAGDTDSESSEEPPAADAISRRSRGRMVSVYGIVSALLGALLIAAVVGCSILWSSHRSDVDEHHYQIRAKKAAAEWALVLMNMNNDNLDASLRRLRDGTAGQLKAGFDATMQPYREAVQRLPSYRSTQLESVVIQSVHHDLGDIGGFPTAAPEPAAAEVGSRTDTIQVAATSVSGSPGSKPQALYWNLAVDVSDVDDNLLISGLRVLR